MQSPQLFSHGFYVGNRQRDFVFLSSSHIFYVSSSLDVPD